MTSLREIRPPFSRLRAYNGARENAQGLGWERPSSVLKLSCLATSFPGSSPYLPLYPFFPEGEGLVREDPRNEVNCLASTFAKANYLDSFENKPLFLYTRRVHLHGRRFFFGGGGRGGFRASFRNESTVFFNTSISPSILRQDDWFLNVVNGGNEIQFSLDGS